MVYVRVCMQIEGFGHVLVFPSIDCTGYENHIGDWPQREQRLLPAGISRPQTVNQDIRMSFAT